MSKNDNSLAHTRWNCKYHIVFTLKYRRKNIYGELKEVEIIGVYVISKLRFMGYLKGRSAVIIHQRHTNLKYNYGNRSFWARGYYVSTVGLNQKTIQKYIREQESENRLSDSISKREYIDPFKQSKQK